MCMYRKELDTTGVELLQVSIEKRSNVKISFHSEIRGPILEKSIDFLSFSVQKVLAIIINLYFDVLRLVDRIFCTNK